MKAPVSHSNRAIQSSLGMADKVQDDMPVNKDDRSTAYESMGSHKSVELLSEGV